ncbi:hypothetical protein DYU05_06600 [Mucilaginibacter terrenus]|uniref:Uncharacterized protein n=1 Tax=Mucilaginibacter terrenus TaxID=2482727 RepID=A0A3E2NW72_9SPHI|nr:hypothetical protein DYU05_06600 [Mucilaginibacter terrenus]
MDRIQIKCAIDGAETELQLDKKAMPGEAGPCYMVTMSGCFRGYIAYQKTGCYRSIGIPNLSDEELQTISAKLTTKRR